MWKVDKELKAQRLGEKRLMKCGEYCTIIEYNKAKDITVKFDDGTIRQHILYYDFKKGHINKGKRFCHVKPNNIIGKRYGSLTVSKLLYRKMSKCGYKYIYYYECKCDCGNTCVKSINYLKCNNNLKSEKSCGCKAEKAHSTLGSVEEIYPNLISLFKNKEDVKESVCSHKRAIIVCPICRKEKEHTIKYITNNNGFSCDICRDTISYPEKFLRSFLNQLNVNYEVEKTFNWSELKRYDFYIPSLNCIIETHGEQHYKENSRTLRTLKEEKENDNLKEKLAKDNGILNYIALNCSKSKLDHIKNSIEHSVIPNIINLENIDYLKCDFEAIDNMLKNICEFWNNMKEKRTITIANEFKLSRRCVSEYLKRGNEIGLCNYDPRKSIKESFKYRKPANTTRIICVELNKQFDSLNECIRYFKENFDIRLDRSAIYIWFAQRKEIIIKVIILNTFKLKGVLTNSFEVT